MLLFFSLPIQYQDVETRHSRLLQASEQCFRKTPHSLKIYIFFKKDGGRANYQNINNENG